MYRSFTIKNIDGQDWFIMYSQFNGEFSDGVLVTRAPLFVYQPEDYHVQLSIEQSCEVYFNSSDIPFDFRIKEMEFFCKTFSLFNPLNDLDHGKTSSPFPSENA